MYSLHVRYNRDVGASMSRRRFLSKVAFAGAGAIFSSAIACSNPPEQSPATRTWHPEPRPGVDGSKVVSGELLKDSPELLQVFDMVRDTPEVMDGVRCHCNCAVKRRLRSLLVCFEGDGMARDCDLCLQQARRVYELYRSGMSLEQLRIVIDAAFA